MVGQQLMEQPVVILITLNYRLHQKSITLQLKTEIEIYSIYI